MDVKENLLLIYRRRKLIEFEANVEQIEPERL